MVLDGACNVMQVVTAPREVKLRAVIVLSAPSERVPGRVHASCVTVGSTRARRGK